MTNPDYTAIMLLIDRSGSMIAIRDSAESAIREFILDQANQPGRRSIRIAQFDTEYFPVHGSVPAGEAPLFKLEPRGGTALLDAMARAMTHFGAELSALPEDGRPGNVIFAVMTDGEENSSVEFTWDQVKAMVETQQNTYGWHVLYLGANQDAIATAAKVGIAAGQSMTYAASAAGVTGTTSGLSAYASRAAGGQSVFDSSFTDAERDDAQQK
jgi:hypothetical protein